MAEQPSSALAMLTEFFPENISKRRPVAQVLSSARQKLRANSFWPSSPLGTGVTHRLPWPNWPRKPRSWVRRSPCLLKPYING